MSNRTHHRRAGRVGSALALGLAFAAVPAVAQAAPVDLGTAKPFVVLGGQSVSNTGPSVLNGDLGVSPGTSLPGFGSPAVVNGATHNNDAVAAQAQQDLTTAYNVAAAEPSSDLTGQDLGGLRLTAGAYGYTSSAQLTGTVTFDAENDPNAQFVIKVASALTTASASSVQVINGANPCNIYWQIGSSATLGSTTAFKGNVMALTSISLNNGASVIGRLLARNGSISLINNVLDASQCSTGSSAGGGQGGSGGGSGQDGTSQGGTSQGGTSRNGIATLRRMRSTPNGRTPNGRTPNSTCTDGFRARVRGKLIKRVVFSLDGSRIASRIRSPFQVYVKAAPGRHEVRARVTFKDSTRAKTLTLPYRACAAAVRQPRRGPSRFTG